MKIWSDYYKVIKVIDSCLTVEQLKSASKMLGFWLDVHKDNIVYRNTLTNHIEKKFKELGGSDFTSIPSRSQEIYEI